MNIDYAYFKYSWLVLHMSYLRTVFCFIFLRSQAIISDQIWCLKSWGGEREIKMKQNLAFPFFLKISVVFFTTRRYLNSLHCWNIWKVTSKNVLKIVFNFLFYFRYQLELVSTYLCTYHRMHEFIIALANYNNGSFLEVEFLGHILQLTTPTIN